MRRYIQVNGARVSYLVSGEGPAIVFVHGNPDSAHGWRGVTREIGGAFNCIAVDLPGFGMSEAARDTYRTVEAQGAWLIEFLNATGLHRPVHLVVHDLGAWIGLPAVVAEPARFSRVVVVNAPFGRDYAWHLYARLWRTPGLGELAMLGLSHNRAYRCHA